MDPSKAPSYTTNMYYRDPVEVEPESEASVQLFERAGPRETASF